MSLSGRYKNDCVLKRTTSSSTMFHTIRVLSMQFDNLKNKLFFLLFHLLTSGWIISNATSVGGS